jgi:hypothetical protein
LKPPALSHRDLEDLLAVNADPQPRKLVGLGAIRGLTFVRNESQATPLESRFCCVERPMGLATEYSSEIEGSAIGKDPEVE